MSRNNWGFINLRRQSVYWGKKYSKRVKFSVVKAVSQGRFSFLGKMQLVKMRSRAMRAGVWFRALPRIDRVLIDLTIKVTDSVHSSSLARCVLSVARKLEGLLESKFNRAIREVGFPLARKLSLFARMWGNVGAAGWPRDAGFARYLAVMRFNGHSCASV
jgi:hypothetical protein